MSWSSWRDDKIEPEEFANEPISGFVLNKKVGDYSGSWGEHRQAYCRIYDPRGFEFEITINNLLFILEHCVCRPGKGLDGEFVYGWEGKDLVLLPVNSPDFKEIKSYTKRINTSVDLKGKDLKIGATYTTKDNEEWVYLGRFDKWSEQCCSDPVSIDSKNKYSWDRFENVWVESRNKGKHYWFFNKDAKYKFERIVIQKGLSKKIIGVVDESCVQNYSDLYEEIEGMKEFSPVDYSKDEIIACPFEDFANYFSGEGWKCGYFRNNKNEEVRVIRNGEEYRYYILHRKVDVYHLNLLEVYNEINPIIIKRYLSNGRCQKLFN